MVGLQMIMSLFGNTEVNRLRKLIFSFERVM